jgi:hypothetical protein
VFPKEKIMWVKTMPNKVGLFHTAARDGAYAGIREVIVHSCDKGKLSNTKYVDTKEFAGRPWAGWWWNVPIAMPPAITIAWEAAHQTEGEVYGK